MTLFFHELRRGKLSLAIWSLSIAFMFGITILIFPEMSAQMEEMSAMFADMGSFSAAFGMDQINFGEFSGYFSVECGNVLGLGGAFFASIIGINALSKEEKNYTASFLLSHPISRIRVVFEKLLAVIFQIIMFNLIVVCVTLLTITIIGEEIDSKSFALIFLAYLIMQIEIAAITFGISSFIKNGSLGIGLGISFLMYFLNILSNITKNAEFLKYISAFSYTDGAKILANNSLNTNYLLVGIAFTLLGVLSAFIKYNKKDIT